jgi:hypothetical protein
MESATDAIDAAGAASKSIWQSVFGSRVLIRGLGVFLSYSRGVL